MNPLPLEKPGNAEKIYGKHPNSNPDFSGYVAVNTCNSAIELTD